MSATPPAAVKSLATSAGTAPKRVAKAVLIGAVPPLMLKMPANPAGTPMEAFDQIRAESSLIARSFGKICSLPFYGYNRPGAKISEGVRESFWLQGMMAGFPASYFCINAFSETDFTEDLKKIDVPTPDHARRRRPDRADRRLGHALVQDRRRAPR